MLMMRIVTTRRISQGVFLLLFFWFCLVTTLGAAFWQLRGWPVNWLIQLDPLVGIGTLLATGTLYSGLLWGVLTVTLTIFLGRFFCGWVCPMGTLQHLVGFLAHGRRRVAEKVRLNRYRPAQTVKYGILILFLAAAGAELAAQVVLLPKVRPLLFLVLLLIGAALAARRRSAAPRRRRHSWGPVVAVGIGIWLLLVYPSSGTWIQEASLQIGWLDPIPLLHRAMNLALLPIVDGALVHLTATQRYYQGAWAIGALLLAFLFLCLAVPRFFCRFVCPLGALFGLLGRYAFWRIGTGEASCRRCLQCETHCEGACTPSGEIRTAECVLCLNCRESCGDGLIDYRREPSAAGEIPGPDLSRRVFVASLVSGVASVPMLRLGGATAAGWSPRRVRPPGALSEAEFLTRCLKCGQCMRVCPTNVIQPAGMAHGLEGIWTPVLDFRIGTSGCQLNCIACGHVCPTAAIRPISLDEKLGRGAFADRGPLRIGMAFVDRGRCLPWAMDTPCIVCQENCPVSPKAITTDTVFEPLAAVELLAAERDAVRIRGEGLAGRPLTTGDMFCRIPGAGDGTRRRIVAGTENRLVLADTPQWPEPPAAGGTLEIVIRLQRPFVDPRRCIGCGICEHECPVLGMRAIRVTAENETRTPAHGLLPDIRTG